METPCPNEQRLLALLLGEAEGGEREVLEAHVAQCEACALELESLKKTVGLLEREFEAQRVEPRLSDLRREELKSGNVRPIASDRNHSGRLGLRLVPWGALAATAVFGLVAVFYGSRSGDRQIAQTVRIAPQAGDLGETPEGLDLALPARTNEAVEADFARSAEEPRSLLTAETESRSESNAAAPESRATMASSSPPLRERKERQDAPETLEIATAGEREAASDRDAPALRKLAGAGEVAASPPAQALADASSAPLQAAAVGMEDRRIIAPSPIPAGTPAPPNDEAFDAMYFRNYGVNPFFDTAEDAHSTFAIDVDTASYTIVRNYLSRGVLPPPEAVRVEEFVNYLPADYPAPGQQTFAVYSEVAPSPLREGYHWLRIGIKGREVPPSERKPVVLTFVVDVSGSMAREDRLGLVRRTLRMLLQELRPGDRVGLAVYGSGGQEVLAHRDVTEEGAIEDGIDRLQPGGSTNAEEGLRIGYQMARRAFDPGAVNRVILCTDGVANVGRTGAESILDVVGREADDRIYLTALGFGLGNYNDVLLEQLADRGNGHYAYLDSEEEARTFIRRRLVGSMEVIAQDVKIQVEFDPGVVAKYRLLGYENRDVPDHEFRRDAVDAGEVGAGHATSALYELKLAGPGEGSRLGLVRLRFKDPGRNLTVREIEGELTRQPVRRSFDEAGESFRLMWIAAQFAEVLRGSVWARDLDLASLTGMLGRANEWEASNSAAAELGAMMEQALRLKTPKPSRPIPLAEPGGPPAEASEAGRPLREDAVPLREAR